MAVFSSAISCQLGPFIGIRILVHGPDAARSAISGAGESLYITSRPVRPAYSYSVIPGGVGSAEEFRQISDHDPVVAQQFQGFDYANAHLVTVSEKQLIYVAFRKGDKVYWTRKKVALHPGETLIAHPVRQSRGGGSAWSSGSHGSVDFRF
jgi:hypothetical protein